jgi:amino acid transporter
MRLPRWAYWIAGALIAFAGAIGARLLAAAASGQLGIAIWLVGAVFIFVGLAVLSFGTRTRGGVEPPSNTSAADEPPPNRPAQ